MPQRRLNWPRRIARADRVPLAIGHGSFCLNRIHLGTDAFDRQRIQLGGYLLLVVRAGSAILDSGEHSILLQEGEGCLIPPSEFCMTEIPRPQFTRGETLWYFLNKCALADVVANREGVDEMAARIALPTLPFFPLRHMATVLAGAAAIGSMKSWTDLRGMFTALLNSGSALMYNFLKHEVFVSRLRLCLFLEEHSAGKLAAGAIASRYPLGARAFNRDSTNYLGLPVEQWLFRRRIELAQAWLRHVDVTEHEVASRFGYDGLRRFRGDMKRFGHFSPLELEVLRRFSSRANGCQEVPFWFPSAEARAAKFHRDHQDFLWIAGTPHRKAELEALLRKYPDHKPATAPAPGWLTADPRLTTESDIPHDPVKELENIIDLKKVEAWQAGGAALISEPRASQLAA